MFGISLVDIEKSTLTAIRLLFDEGRWPAALTILMCSVVAPFVKLAVLLVCAFSVNVKGYAGPEVSSAITAVRRISKWATVDAFTASILVAFFTSNATLKVELHRGFYCFVGYCVFSVAGALVLEKPTQEAAEEQRRLVPGSSSPQKPWGAAVALSVVGSLALLVVLDTMPIFDVQCTMLNLEEQLSFVMIVQRLLTFGSRLAAFLCVACVALLPAADVVWTAVEATTGRTERHPIGEWLQDFAMFDVFALAIIVTQNASSGINANLTVKVLPGGWFFIICGAMWLLYSFVLRSQTVVYGPLSKDKLGAAAAVLEGASESEKLA